MVRESPRGIIEICDELASGASSNAALNSFDSNPLLGNESRVIVGYYGTWITTTEGAVWTRVLFYLGFCAESYEPSPSVAPLR